MSICLQLNIERSEQAKKQVLRNVGRLQASIDGSHSNIWRATDITNLRPHLFCIWTSGKLKRLQPGCLRIACGTRTVTASSRNTLSTACHRNVFRAIFCGKLALPSFYFADGCTWLSLVVRTVRRLFWSTLRLAGSLRRVLLGTDILPKFLSLFGKSPKHCTVKTRYRHTGYRRSRVTGTRIACANFTPQNRLRYRHTKKGDSVHSTCWRDVCDHTCGRHVSICSLERWHVHVYSV